MKAKYGQRYEEKAENLLFQKITNFTIFCVYEVQVKKNETTSLLPI